LSPSKGRPWRQRQGFWPKPPPRQTQRILLGAPLARKLQAVILKDITNHLSNSRWAVFRLATNSRLLRTRTPMPRSKQHGTLASDTTTWLRGTDLGWLSAATVTSFITRSGANTFFPRRWASCSKPRKLRRTKSTFLFHLHPTM